MLKILAQLPMKFLPAITLGLVVITPVINNINMPATLAQSDVKCKEDGTMAEMKKCADEKYVTADEQLNQVYEQLMVRVKDQITAKEYLIQAQRAWITMRDKGCSFESTPFAGGSIEGLVYTKCLTRMTETRTKELTNYVNTWGKEPGEANTPKPTSTVSPSPNSSMTIDQLPDGNYRYATAKLSQSIISDQDLVRAGGYYFLFRKQGRNIVGTLAQVDSENTICVSGKINGNTVTGRAVELVELPERDPSVKSIDDKFVFWDLGGDILSVRRGEKKDGKVIYNGALLNLGTLSRYNVGTRPPISQCPF
jgi:uncharacterized protein YecT (DUF1311 family)